MHGTFRSLITLCLALGLVIGGVPRSIGAVSEATSARQMPATLKLTTQPFTTGGIVMTEWLKNGGFNTYTGTSNIPTGWKATNFASTDGKDLLAANRHEGTAALKIRNASVIRKTLKQTLALSGAAGDLFKFSYWVKGIMPPNAGLCQGQVIFYKGTKQVGIKTLVCGGTGTFAYRQNSLSFLAPAAYTSVVVAFAYSKPTGTVWFDGASLHRSLPALTLKAGDFYFSRLGTPSFLFSRNLAGYQPDQFQQLLGWTKSGGSEFVRLSLDDMGMGFTNHGAIDPNWVAHWNQVLDSAEADGIYVLPTFSTWYDWNAGKGYSTWKYNPLNKVNGGPATTPAELFHNGSQTQILWLAWVKAVVTQWHGRHNILGWEVFSEVNLASGATESSGVNFVNRAAKLIRSADPAKRPITASLAETGTWLNFYRDTSIDFINVHPYPASGQLDRALLSMVPIARTTYNRPVLIGESGLSAATPDTLEGKLTVAPNAHIGIRHAIWAGIVSGAMNGRALWWEDGVGIYFPKLGMPWLQKYAAEERAAANFVTGVNFAGFAPLQATTTPQTWGAAIGNNRTVIGWFRDAACEPPNWNLKPLLSNQTATITVPGSASSWKVYFYRTSTGTDIVGSLIVPRTGSSVTVHFPPFTDDIAFKMVAQP